MFLRDRYIDIYFIDLGYSESDLGTYVMITGFVSLAASILLVRLFSRMKKQLLLIAVIHIISAGIVFYVFRAQPFITMMYTIYMLYVIFRAIYVPLEQSYIAKEAKEGSYGSIMGLRQSFVSLGMVLGPLLGGFLYEASPIWLFDFNGILFLLGVILLFFIIVMQQKKKRLLEKAQHIVNEQMVDEYAKTMSDYDAID
jgi:DHA1 family multidrug resistance protein-like MFS transporter